MIDHVTTLEVSEIIKSTKTDSKKLKRTHMRLHNTYISHFSKIPFLDCNWNASKSNRKTQWAVFESLWHNLRTVHAQRVKIWMNALPFLWAFLKFLHCTHKKWKLIVTILLFFKPTRNFIPSNVQTLRTKNNWSYQQWKRFYLPSPRTEPYGH